MILLCLYLYCIGNVFNSQISIHDCSEKMSFYAHGVKSVCIRNCSGPYFLAFRLNAERYSISFRIQFECGKIWARITPNTDTFSAVAMSGESQRNTGEEVR